MKKLLLFIPVFFLFLLTANATDYYIAANGNDYNSGTSQSSPWKSIDKVNAYFSYMKPGDKVLFRRGDTFYGGIVVNKTGTVGAPITIGAYGSGAKPIITGFTTVTSWKNLGGNIWESSSPVSTLDYTNMVVVNGVNTAMGRYPNSTGPNTGYMTIKSTSGTTSISSDQLTGSPNWKGASIVIRKERWGIERGTITGHSGGTLNYTDDNVYPAKKGYGFFIQNDPKTLDVNNEWYYNPSTKKLRIYSTSIPKDVKIASVESLVFASAKNYIIIDGLAFTGANSDAINCFNYGSYLTIQNCDVSFAGETGIHTEVNYSTIENNNVSYVNYMGILAIQRDATIRSNNIKNVDMFEGMGQTISSAGIKTGAENATIQSNRVDSCGYVGIIFGGKNTLVKNNFVNAFCITKDDGAGIAMGARERAVGSVIDENIILNTTGATAGAPGGSTDASGIMIDAWGSGITISNNTVANCVNIGIKLHGSRNIVVKNNTAYNNGGLDWSKGGLELLSRRDYLIRNVSINENIFFARTAEQHAFFGSPDPGTLNDLKLFGSADDNYYAKPIDPNTAILIGSTPYSVQGWQSYSGHDANSKGAPKTITDVNDLRFVYNATAASKTVSLDAAYIDVKGNSYNGSITLSPFSSAVLIKNGELQNQPPTANAGDDQTITLPANSTVLEGSGSVSRGTTINKYFWSKKSGPSSGKIVSPISASTSVTDLVEGVYVFELTVTDNIGVSSTSSVQITVQSSGNLLPAVYPSNLEKGIDYKYYEGTSYSVVPDFSQLTPVKTGSVNNFDISVANRENVFAFEFTGYIDIPKDGQYTFYTTSDDGSMLYIDNQLIVDNNGLHGAIEKSGTIGLKAGKHSISVGFFEQDGSEILDVNYAGPGISKRVVPNSILYRVSSEVLLPAVNPPNLVNGLDFKYYEGTGYSVVPDFSQLTPVKTGSVNNFDISVANREDIFAFEFTGYIDIPADGQYTFYTTSDDGSMLYIDNQLVVDNNGLHGAIEKSGTIGLKAGKHSITVGFFEQNGSEILNVNYAGPGISKRAVPNSGLYRTSTGNLLPALNPANVVSGLEYKYYESGSYTVVPDFSEITPVKTGFVNYFDLNVANKSERYAISFNGYIDVPVDGQYSFYTTSDDGSVLYIDNKLVVNNDGLHSAIEESGTIGLKAGKHLISVGFFQQDWDKSLSVSYAGPGIAKQTIPYSILFRENESNGLNYSYYEASSFSSVPDFSKISPVKTGSVSNFDISVANRTEVFAIEFTGFINIPTNGQYTFYTTSDDGSMLYIDNKVIVNNDGLHGALERSGSVYLAAGRHAISVGFFQQTLDKMLEVRYAGPGISKRLIPSTELYPDVSAYGRSGFGSGPLSSISPLRDQSVDDLKPIAISAYPNPFINSLNVTLNGEAGEYKLQMMDAVGRILWTRSGSKNEGFYQQAVNTSALQKGIYFLRVIQNEKSSVIKLLK